jgi:DNA-binding LacI/PurR family transcriptional regulator
MVAEKAGVSKSTVSRVLNKYTEGFSVKPELRTRILHAVQELDYEPDLFVRTMKSKKTGLVACQGELVTSRHGGFERDDITREVVNHLDAAGYNVCSTYNKMDGKSQYFPPFKCDGVVVPHNCNPARLRKLDQSGLPYVSVNGLARGNGCSVIFDERQGVQLALDHLIERGHRNIAYYNALRRINGKQHYSIKARQQAYGEVMQRHGLAPSDYYGDHFVEFEDFLSHEIKANGATAVLTYDLTLALALMGAARDMGLRIPEDFSLVSFNDGFVAEAIRPKLTCIALPAEDIGKASVTLLLQMMAGEPVQKEHPVKIKEKLVIRESTRAVFDK